MAFTSKEFGIASAATFLGATVAGVETGSQLLTEGLVAASFLLAVAAVAKRQPRKAVRA